MEHTKHSAGSNLIQINTKKQNIQKARIIIPSTVSDHRLGISFNIVI